MTPVSINNIGIEKNTQYQKGNPNFTGALDGAVRVLKTFNDKPMIGVAFTDTVATNAPRSIFDFLSLGPAAGFETARREFSGLIVNCLMPSFFVLGAAKLINGHYMKDFKGINISSSWANSETIDTLKDVYKDVLQQGTSDSKETARNFVRQTLENIEGLNGKEWISYADKLNSAKGKEAIEALAEAISNPSMSKKDTKNAIKKAITNLAKETEAVETLRFKDGSINNALKTGTSESQSAIKSQGRIFGSNLADLLRDQVDLGRTFSHDAVKNNLDKFAQNAKKMVNTKSMMGLAIVLPLAMSMQYINRAITRHKYKKTGAPIYKDFEKDENRVLTPEEQKKLSKTKPVCVASMVGLALLSMMKKPSLEMFQFKGMFPTIDQCRWIATGTFASRMLAAEDPNELRESTVRDIASFSGLYFLGDYASKATATLIEKLDKSVKLLNHTKETTQDASIFRKFGNWVKNIKVKSFDEVANSAKATKYRGICELASLGFSIVTLGILLPMHNKRVTAKKEAERKANLQKEQNKIQQMASTTPNVTLTLPQNQVKTPIAPGRMFIHPMKDTSIGKNSNVSILNGTKVKDLEVTTFNVQESNIKGYYNFEMKGKFKDWEDYTQDDVFKNVATECFR